VALASASQDDFGSGIYRGRKAPGNSLYDAVNVLISDEGLPFRRGGSAYYSTSNMTGVATRLYTPYMRGPKATRVLAVVPGGDLYALNGARAPVDVGTGAQWGRPASIGDYAVFAYASPTTFVLYGGTLKTATYSTGSVTVTPGDTTVTGTGTAWLANADAGMVLAPNLGGIGVVASVQSNTSLTLASPWTGPSVTTGGYALLLSYTISTSLIPGGADATSTQRPYVVAAGAGTPRLLCAIGNRVYFTPRGDPLTWSATDYHELPANVVATGAEGIGDSARIFTTGGDWLIGNLSLDDVDAFGNLQHTVQQINKDVVLWDDFGIAGWAGGSCCRASTTSTSPALTFRSLRSRSGSGRSTAPT
jgi:hypothetical protein